METRMTCVNVLQEIVGHFVPKRAQPLHLNNGTHLLDEAAIDSPRMIDVILEVEDRFQLTLEDEEVQNVRTFGDLVDLVQSRTASRVLTPPAVVHNLSIAGDLRVGRDGAHGVAGFAPAGEHHILSDHRK